MFATMPLIVGALPVVLIAIAVWVRPVPAPCREAVVRRN
jgi:hypothetical protein